MSGLAGEDKDAEERSSAIVERERASECHELSSKCRLPGIAVHEAGNIPVSFTTRRRWSG